MSKYIALDDGHGIETAGKRTPAISELNGRVIKENEFNEAVVSFLNVELKRHGFKTLLTSPEKSDTPLATRVKLANDAKVDLFISIHYNALNGQWGSQNGFSAHVYLNNKNTESGKFAATTLKHLAQGTTQTNRGIIEQDLYVTRNTKMPAVLFELGFMDNKREALLMANVSFQKECAMEIAQGVCEYFGVEYEEAAAPIAIVTPSKTSSYTVKNGDTLWGVAKAHNLTVAQLKQLNNLISDVLSIGQILKLKVDTKPIVKTEPIIDKTIKIVGKIKISNLNNFTYIYSKPNEMSIKIDKAYKNAVYNIAGSVPGWFEIIHENKRAYIKNKYGVRV